MKTSCEYLREHAIKIINFKKEKMKLSINEQQNSETQKPAIFVRKTDDKHATDEKYRKVGDHCHYTGEYRGAARSIYNLKYSVPKEIPIVFHNGSNDDYHFIIKEFAEEFEKQFTCLGENIEKYTTFSVPIEKDVRITDKNGEKIRKNISYILQFIDSEGCMASSLSNFVNNLSERIHKIK